MKFLTVAVLVLLMTAFMLGQDEYREKAVYMGPNGEVIEGVRCATDTDVPGAPVMTSQDLQRWRESNPQQRSGNILIYVAFHIISNGSQGIPTMAQVEDQIQILDDAFADAGIDFELLVVDTTDNASWFTNPSGNETAMKSALAIDPAHVFNIYTAQPSGGILGWAYLPWTWSETYFMHGIVLLWSSLPGGSAFPYNEGDTGTHEAGHYLGLYHTFENGCGGLGDEVDDTEPESAPRYGCPAGAQSCSTPDPIYNFMDYTDDDCMNHFTTGQNDRMLWALETFKPSMLENRLGASAPTQLSSYSDYNTPTSIQMSWDDPLTFVNGEPLDPDSFQIHIARDGMVIDTVSSGVGAYTDEGLMDGQSYSYEVTAFLLGEEISSDPAATSWYAGGSPIPSPSEDAQFTGSTEEMTVNFTAPSTNEDGTPMDDFAGVNLYRNGNLAESFSFATSDTGQALSVTHTLETPGFYEFYVTMFDDEATQNESASSDSFQTPIAIPFVDVFGEEGDPNPAIWYHENAAVNELSSMPPSEPYALNLNGQPNGGDLIESMNFDLTGLEESGIAVSYYYQPQGLETNDKPETNDSLSLRFLNDVGEWVVVAAYPGSETYPFVQEIVDINTASSGNGTYFHGGFKMRFNTLSAFGNTPHDEWFIDDISISFLVNIDDPERIPNDFSLGNNYPNPFNPTTTLVFEVAERTDVKLVIYNSLGQRVRTLVSETRNPGFHKVIWDGRNDDGTAVSTGTYLYRFEAGGTQVVKKMTLIK